MAVSLQDTRDNLKMAIKKDKIPYALAKGNNIESAKFFPNDLASICYLFDRSGRAVWGGRVQDFEQATEVLDKTLAEKYSAKPAKALATTTVTIKTRIGGSADVTTGGSVKKKPKASKYPNILVLKNGTRIRGRTIANTSAKVFFKDENGKGKFYPKSDVERIEKTK